MFENVINFFKKIGKKDQIEAKSKDTAKERLHLVLMQDRANVSADFLDMMRQEIIEVINKACKDNCLYLNDNYFVPKTMFRYVVQRNVVECVDPEYLDLCKEEILYNNKKNMVVVIRNDGELLKMILDTKKFKLYEKKCDKNIFGEETAECYKIYVRYVNN